MSRKLTVFFRILFFVYVATVLALCFFPFNDVSQFPRYIWGIPIDKVVHFCMFFPFPILAFLAYDPFTDTVPSCLAFAGITFLVGALMAVGTELGQEILTNYRKGDCWDLVADVIALSISAVFVLVWDLLKLSKHRS